MKLLFICTHNRCRSILAEAITNHLSHGRIVAASAGSSPQQQIHPLSLHYLQRRNIDTNGLVSQSWEDFEDFAADAILTLCDQAAAEPCPVWFDESVQVHWGLQDPSNATNDDQADQSFNRTIDVLSQRIEYLLDNNIDHLSGEQLSLALNNVATNIP